MPALASPNEASQFSWKNWEPRIGITYALGAEKKMLLKASYARFADQMGNGNVTHDNANQIAGLYYYWNDANHDHVVTNEIDFASGIQAHYGFDPAHPTSVVSANTFDRNLKAGVTDEFLGGIDYEVMPELVVGTTYTHRKYSGIAVNQNCKTVDSTGKLCLAYLGPSDFQFVKNVTGTLFDGTAYSMPLYGLNTGVSVPAGTGELNRMGYSTTYDGIEMTMQKRLSNRWMMRGNFSWSNWKQQAGTGSCSDPTNSLNGSFGASCVGGVAGTGSDNMVSPSGTGSGAFGNVFVDSRWAFNVSGLYELPWGFNVAANVLAAAKAIPSSSGRRPPPALAGLARVAPLPPGSAAGPSSSLPLSAPTGTRPFSTLISGSRRPSTSGLFRSTFRSTSSTWPIPERFSSGRAVSTRPRQRPATTRSTRPSVLASCGPALASPSSSESILAPTGLAPVGAFPELKPRKAG